MEHPARLARAAPWLASGTDAAWAPPPDWPQPPSDWQYWEPMSVPVVTASDVEADPAEAPGDALPANLDPRFALDVEIAKGLPGSTGSG